MSTDRASYYEEEKIGKAYDSAIIRRLLSYLGPYLVMFFGSVFMAFAATAAELMLPYVLKMVIDQYITPSVQSDAVSVEFALEGIQHLGLIYLALLVARFLSMYAQNILLYYVGQNVMRDLRRQVFGKLLRLPIDSLDERPTGRLVTRATNDVKAINEMYSEVVVSLLKDLFMVIGILAIMLVLDWKLTLIVLTLAPLAYWISKVFRDLVREAYRRMRRKVAKLNSYVDEHLSGVEMIKSFTQEERSTDEFEAVNEEEFDSRMEQLKIYGVFRPLVHLMRIVATALVLWVGGFLVIESSFTIGSLVLFLSYIEKLFKPLRELAQRYDVMQKAMASAERIFQVIDEESETYRGNPVPAISGGQGGRKISFQNVWFRYGSASSDADWVLRDVSFTVEPGEQVALVGPTGAGKTTVFKLLLRWHDVQRGRILLDGVDIRELDLQALRSTFGVVLQDGFLFSGDVMENLRFMSADISAETVRKTAEEVGVDRYIQRLSEGYQTEIFSKGDQISEGQRQLLTMTRAMASDPEVVLFDEATTGMDSSTEDRLLTFLDESLTGRTAVTIAHRISTVRNSDRIYVFDQGEIVERGDHRTLLENDELYATLYRMQMKEQNVSNL